MPRRIKPESLPHTHDEEHLIRRLGKALALRWDMLSEATQAKLLEQASLVEDEVPALHLKEQLQRYLDKHREFGKHDRK